MNLSVKYAIIIAIRKLIYNEKRGQKMAIILAAPIGAGKSTVTTALSEMMGLPAAYESVSDNPVLPLYYSDRKRYGFHLQMYFLERRISDMQAMYAVETSAHRHVISDRSIIEDKAIFATQLHDTGMMNDVEFDIYTKNLETDLKLLDSYKELTNGTKEDLLIFLNPPFERTLEQIVLRGREFEQFDKNPELKDYYKDIYDRYSDWYKEYHRTPKIEIKNYDVITTAGRQKFYDQLQKKMKEINFVL